jgi:hypothetical protein
MMEYVLCRMLPSHSAHSLAILTPLAFLSLTDISLVVFWKFPEHKKKTQRNLKNQLLTV